MTITNQQLFAKAAEMTANYLGCPKEHLALDTDLISEYYMDSLDLVDLGIEIERTFPVELSADASSHIRTLEDIVLLVQAAMNASVAARTETISQLLTLSYNDSSFNRPIVTTGRKASTS